MFHVELRQFPHTACAFNLDEAELLELVVPWSRAQWIELGERKWSPHQARMTVLDGPRLPVEDLAIGRGWRNAQRRSRDVTEHALARARALRRDPEAAAAEGEPAVAEGVVAAAGARAAEGAAAPGVAEGEPRSLLGSDPDALLRAWRLVAERRPELAPSAALALAEATLRAPGEGEDRHGR